VPPGAVLAGEATYAALLREIGQKALDIVGVDAEAVVTFEPLPAVLIPDPPAPCDP
jgi:hypothetical protein